MNAQFRRAYRCTRIVAASLILVATPLVAQNSGTPPTPRTIVRGSVFDSLLMKPAANASVWVAGGTQTTSADDQGRFELDDVPLGTHFIAFSSPALDSLGLGTLGSRVNIAGGSERVALATPSFATVWRALCATTYRASTDSGIVWGTVRDADTDTRLSGAATAFDWYDMRVVAGNKVDLRQLSHLVRTDSTGTYYACGLPSTIKISSEAAGTRSASGSIEYLIGERRLTRIDLLVSSDMVLQKPLNDASVIEMSPRGSANLRGRVVDSKGKDVVGAAVTLAGRDTVVRTNQLGEFTLTMLAAGTHGLQARSVGFAPATMLVELRPGKLTQVTMHLPDARTLATVNVRADRAAGSDQLEFLERQKLGMGYTLKASDINGRPDVASVLQGMPSLQVTRRLGQVGVSMSNRSGGNCVPGIYIDRIRSSVDEVSINRPEDFAAVEIYNSQFTVPVGYEGNNCGVLLFWTKRNARW